MAQHARTRYKNSSWKEITYATTSMSVPAETISLGQCEAVSGSVTEWVRQKALQRPQLDRAASFMTAQAIIELDGQPMTMVTRDRYSIRHYYPGALLLPARAGLIERHTGWGHLPAYRNLIIEKALEQISQEGWEQVVITRMGYPHGFNPDTDQTVDS